MDLQVVGITRPTRRNHHSSGDGMSYLVGHWPELVEMLGPRRHGINTGIAASPDPIMVWPEEPAWKQDAACKTSDVNFYPTQGQTTLPAKAVCRTCPVIDECFEHAMSKPERYGIWAGLSERERRRLRRERNAA